MAYLATETMNNVIVESDGVKMIQLKGCVQGASAAPKLFSAVYEDVMSVVTSRINHKHQIVKASMYVDDVALMIEGEHADKTRDVYMETEKCFKAIGMELGHGTDKDGVLAWHERHVKLPDHNKVQMVHSFKYLGVRLSCDMKKDELSLGYRL